MFARDVDDALMVGTDQRRVQATPLNVVHKVITDDALPASVRLDLSKAGIQIILARE